MPGDPLFKSPTEDTSVDSGKREDVPEARVPADIRSGGPATLAVVAAVNLIVRAFLGAINL